MAMDPERAALESIMADSSTARLGPSRVKDGGAVEILRALGLVAEADMLADAMGEGAMPAGGMGEGMSDSGEYELDDEEDDDDMME